MENGIDKKSAGDIFLNGLDRHPVVNKDRKSIRPSARKIQEINTLDLHGCHVNDGLSRLENFIRNARSQGVRSVRIITGKGLNSPGLYSPLKNAVEEFLEKSGLTYKTASGVTEICLKD